MAPSQPVWQRCLCWVRRPRRLVRCAWLEGPGEPGAEVRPCGLEGIHCGGECRHISMNC